MNRADKQNLKKLKQKAKLHKRAAGRKPKLPPNKVILDKRSKILEDLDNLEN